MYSTKHTSFIRTLLSNSQADDINDSSREWRIAKIGYSDHYSSCEFCGTAIKKHAIIKNDITEATLIIGLTCLENLRCVQKDLEFPDFKEYVNSQKTLLKSKIKRFYENIDIDTKSWRSWFLSLKNIPNDLREGIAQLRHWGILSDEFVDRFIQYHDDNRLFPREVLIPDDIYNYWEVKLAISIPDYLTINQAREYLEYRAKKEYLEKSTQKLKQVLGSLNNSERCPVCCGCYDSTILKRHLRVMHNYRECPICNEFLSPQTIDTHLIEKHNYQRCPVCDDVIKSNEIGKHLKYCYPICPECGVRVKPENLAKHLKKVHNLSTSV